MAKAALKPPTLEYILELYEDMKKEYQRDNDQIEAMRKAREMEEPAALDPNMRLVDVDMRDPSIADEGFRVTASLTVNPATCTVKPHRKGDKADTNATLRENVSEEVLRVAGEKVKGQGLSTFMASADAVVNDGGAWTKFVYSKDLWDERYSIKLDDFEDDPEDEDDSDKPKTKRSKAQKYNEATEDAKKTAGPPFAWICCDALNVYPVWQGLELGEMLEVQERSQSTTFRQYRLSRDKDGNIVPEELGVGKPEGQESGQNKVLFMEFWDSTWVAYAIVGQNAKGDASGQVVKRWKHGYKRVPYFNAMGLSMNHWRGRKVGWGVGQTKLWLTKYLAYLMAVQAQFAARDCMTPLFREKAEGAVVTFGDDKKPKEKEVWGLREIVEGAPGDKLYPIAFTGTPSSLKDSIALTKEIIESLSTPRMTGNLGSLEGAGFAINQVLAEARLRFDPLAQSIERMLTDITRFMWFLVRTKVREPIWIYREGTDSGWLSAGPDDLTDTVGMSWKLDPERPSAKVIERRYHVEGINAGIESRDEAIEQEGRNPDEVRRGLALDRIRQTDWYIKQFDAAVAEEVGMGDMIEEAMQVAETGMLPGQEAPGAMGSELVPDMAALSMAPNGAGAAPIGPPNGSVTGVGPGAVIPTESVMPTVQNLVG